MYWVAADIAAWHAAQAHLLQDRLRCCSSTQSSTMGKAAMRLCAADRCTSRGHPSRPSSERSSLSSTSSSCSAFRTRAAAPRGPCRPCRLPACKGLPESQPLAADACRCSSSLPVWEGLSTAQQDCELPSDSSDRARAPRSGCCTEAWACCLPAAASRLQSEGSGLSGRRLGAANRPSSVASLL